jgi:cyanamide hydratase
VQTHFPHLTPVLETYYLTCLLHDLGTTGEHMHRTHMSFEYYGSFKAMKFLLDSGASKDQAEAVSEAIIRHADLGEIGTLTTLGMLIQLSTVFGKSPASFSLVILEQYLHCLGRCVDLV